jgi:hypothetical protein
MRHARPDDLQRLEPLLVELRQLGPLTERSPGTFYVNSRAFLHFHADGDDLFADVRLGGPDFERRPASSAADQAALLDAVRLHLGG